MSSGRWGWIFTRSKFGVPYLAARLGYIDRDPGTENCCDQGQGRQEHGRFGPFDRNEETGYGESRQKIKSVDGLFGAIHMFIERLSAGVITHPANSLVRS